MFETWVIQAVGKRKIWVHKRLVLTGTVHARRRIKMCSPGTTLARAESRLPSPKAPRQGIIGLLGVDIGRRALFEVAHH